MLICLTGILCLAPGAWGADPRLPPAIDGGLGYLYEFAAPETTTPFEVDRLDKLLAFVLTPRGDGVSMAGRASAFLEPLAYHEFALARSLPFILGYAHQAGIPPHILTLGTLRYAFWKTFDDRHPDLPNVSERIAQAPSPFVIRGREHDVVTPDPSSGAYYGYDLDRTLIGFRYRQNTLWLSLARQSDPSDVGRKGYVLNAEKAWHCIYSGETGLTRTGLGWVDSYMYKGLTCTFYIQADDTPDRVKVAIFKWLRAGWNDLNFVRYQHIREGLKRFGATLRQIIESPGLPPPARIASVWRRINNLPLDQLRRINRHYLLALEKHYGHKKTFPRRWFNRQVHEGDYVDRLARPQLEAVVFLEYMEGALGMDPLTAPETLLSYLKPMGPK